MSISSEQTLKTHIRNIHSSYSNSWDVLAELSQNAVDAIREWNESHPSTEKEHEIDIHIDCTSRSIEYTDTGIGIPPGEAPRLLAPDSTNKQGSLKTIGEKGVGLTFCIFCSNRFDINTKSPTGTYKGSIRSARTWREKDATTDRPLITNESSGETTIDPEETGTKIILDDVETAEGQIDIFDLSIERLEYLLRTKTAIGNTKKKFSDDEPEISVCLTIESEHETFEKEINYEYWFPDMFWDSEDVIDIHEFTSQEGIDKMTDEDKRDQLSGKAWLVKGTKERSAGPDIRYYGLFTPSKNDWDKISRQNELYEEIGEEDDQISDVQPGIYVATRGMPTGVTIDRPDTGSAGYWDQFYLLIGYDGFDWDYGRKKVPSATQGMLRDVAREQFREVTYWRRFVGSGSSKTPPTKPPQISRLEREDRFEELDGLPELNTDLISFKKTPNNQEAGVVAIFHELIGSGELSNFQCMRAGYQQDYDFWGYYQANISEIGDSIRDQWDDPPEKIKSRVVVEFKYKCSQIIPDIESRIKHFNDIDVIVCWKVDEDNFEDTGVRVKKLDESERFYVGSNYKLEPVGGQNWNDTHKDVISLRDFINNQT